LSTIENDTSDLQASLESLDAEKQDSLSNANVEGGQSIKVGSILNRIGTKDNTLTVETEGDIIKFAVDKTIMQEKLDQIDALPDDTTSQSLLVDTDVRRVGVKDTGLTIEATYGVVKLGVDEEVVQEKLTATAGDANSKAVLDNTTVRSVGVDETLSVAENNNVIELAVKKEKIQEKLTVGSIEGHVRASSILSGKRSKGSRVCRA